MLPLKDVFAFNNMVDVGKIVKLANNQRIKFHPSTWDNDKNTRFVDSVIKNIVTPTIIVVRDKNAGGKIHILDGNNRISALVDFANGVRLSDLTDVCPEISGKTFDEISEHNPEFISAIMSNYLNFVEFVVNLSNSQHCEYVDFLKSRYK